MAHSALLLYACITFAPAALLLGWGANGRTSPLQPLSWLGAPISLLCAACRTSRLFVFSSSALDQGIEYLRHKGVNAPTGINRIRQGSDFLVCPGRQRCRLGIRRQWSTRPMAFPRRTDLLRSCSVLCGTMWLYGCDARRAAGADRNLAKPYAMSPRRTFWRILVHRCGSMPLPGLHLWMVADQGDPAAVLAGHRKTRVLRARESGRVPRRRALSGLPPPDGACGIFWRCCPFTLLYPCVRNRL